MSKIAVVSASEVAAHPFYSISPEDYILDEDYIELLLRRFSNNDRLRLRSMVDRGVVKEHDLDVIVARIQRRILNTPTRRAKTIGERWKNVKGETE